MQTSCDVAVGIQGDADAGVPKALLYDLRGYAGGQCHSRPTVLALKERVGLPAGHPWSGDLPEW
jgi:hypothetical protein